MMQAHEEMRESRSQLRLHHHTFGVRGSVPGEYVGILQFSDVVQADAEANIVDHLRWREQVTD